MLPRSIERYGQEIHEFQSLEDFYRDSPKTGAITINYGGHPLDLLHLDRGYDTTIVIFHAALVGSRVKSLPLFSGLRVTKDVPANIICVADPSIRFGIELAWFAGNKDQPLQRDLPNVLRHLLSRYEQSQKMVFFGSSGGGFAALFYGHGFPGSIIVASHPQIRLSEYNPAVVDAYLKSAWDVDSLNATPITHDLNTLYSAGLPGSVLVLQNAWDGHHRDRHLAPWIRAIPRNPQSLYVLVGAWGRGHTPADSETLKAVINKVVTGSFDELANLGFEHAPTPRFIGKRLAEIRAARDGDL